MKRIVLCLSVLLFARPAFAAAMTTWTLLSGSQRSVSSSCAAGTSCDAPTLATQGINLAGVARVNVQVCADEGQTITGGSGLQFYLYDAKSALWGPFNSSVYSVKTGSRCAWVQGDSPGPGIPIVAPRGRLAVVPSSMTVSSGALTVYIFAVDVYGNAI